MTGTMALIGGAEWSEGCTFDADLVAASGSDVVTLLPTAAAYQQPTKVVARAEAWFAALGARVEVLPVLRRADALNSETAQRAADASLLYLCGGSPMHLRSVLKDSPVWDAIVAAWRGGAVLAAATEATTVLSTHMVDLRGGAFTVGLGLLDAVTVIPRYDRWSEDTWHRTAGLAPRGMVVLGIDERTAVVAGEDGWQVSGVGSAVAYRDGQRVDVGELPALGSLTTR